ncbi:MAG: PqqD family protein [Acidobacteriota bacterium]
MPAPEIIFRAMDDGGVLVHLSGNQIYELNETAAHIWTQLASGATESAIVASIVDAFDVDQETAVRQVGDLLKQFVERGLVRT